MTISPGRALILATVSEEAFLQAVIEQAKFHGWWVVHARDSRKSTPGLPDLLLIRPPRVVFAELKKTGGRLSREQVHVNALLAACPGVESYVWHPEDERRITEILRRRP